MKNKIQLDATYYIIMLMLCSICFGHHYAHHQELTTIVLSLPHRPSGSGVAAGWRLSAGRMDRCPDRRLETQYVIRDALCSENLFVNRTVHEPRRP